MFKEIVVRGQLAGCMVTDFSGFRSGAIRASRNSPRKRRKTPRHVDWLNDLAKAIRGEAQPEPIRRVHHQGSCAASKKPLAPDREILAALGKRKKVKLKPRQKKGEAKEERVGFNVAGRNFPERHRAFEAIRDIREKVNHELAPMGRWVGPQEGSEVGLAG